MLERDISYSDIAITVGCSKATISYYAKKIGKSKQNRVYYDWNKIQKFYDEGNSYRDCKAKFGFAAQSWAKAVKVGKIVPRTTKKTIENFTQRQNVKKFIKRNNILPYVCHLCKMEPFWNGKELVLQIDHINGINNDNRIENLRFLCPNCHSQTETFSAKNRKNNRG